MTLENILSSRFVKAFCFNASPLSMLCSISFTMQQIQSAFTTEYEITYFHYLLKDPVCFLNIALLRKIEAIF
jgi:hypothetical protein